MVQYLVHIEVGLSVIILITCMCVRLLLCLFQCVASQLVLYSVIFYLKKSLQVSPQACIDVMILKKPDRDF